MLGDNSDRQIDSTAMMRYVPTIVPSAPPGVVEVSAGYGHVCTRDNAGAVACWGRNTEGQLGIGSKSLPVGPTVVSISAVAQVSAGAYHTCARKSDGSVLCWGEQYTTSPAPIVLPSAATFITAGSYHDCAVVTDGTVWCWGWNAYAQYGAGTAADTISNTPVQASVCP